MSVSNANNIIETPAILTLHEGTKPQVTEMAGHIVMAKDGALYLLEIGSNSPYWRRVESDDF